MELDMRIKNDFIKEQINKLINKMIYKKINMDVDTSINNIEIKTLDTGDIKVEFDGGIILPNSFLSTLIARLI